MELVRPVPKHLASYIAALQQGWSPDTTRGAEAAREALEKIEKELADENTLHLVNFIRRSKRGICRGRGTEDSGTPDD